jgi:hypothetical protein
MSFGLTIYMLIWILLCLVAAVIVVCKRQHFGFWGYDYWRFLLRPWRMIVFVVALAGMTGLAPYSGDPTWDYSDAAFMSILTYSTAPWAIGILYRFRKFHNDLWSVYVALCLWLFSAGWSYDLYILLRDGIYPPTWLSNLILSSILYWAAGCLWSLTGKSGGITLAFRRPDWFRIETSLSYWLLSVYALPFILLAVAMTGAAFISFGKMG